MSTLVGVLVALIIALVLSSPLAMVGNKENEIDLITQEDSFVSFIPSHFMVF